MNDWFREFLELQTKDPQAFFLMIGCISLLVFLSLTIFGGFIWYLYKGDQPANRTKPENSKSD
jgi:hypothetical protein